MLQAIKERPRTREDEDARRREDDSGGKELKNAEEEAELVLGACFNF